MSKPKTVTYVTGKRDKLRHYIPANRKGSEEYFPLTVRVKGLKLVNQPDVNRLVFSIAASSNPPADVLSGHQRETLSDCSLVI